MNTHNRKTNFMSSSLFAAAVLFASQGFAQQLVFNRVVEDTTQIAPLNEFHLDAKSGLPATINSGYIQVRSLNGEASQLILTLQRPFFCKKGSICAMVMPMPNIEQVPVDAYSMNRCGVKTYHGSLDERQAGGALKHITVIDNTDTRCPATLQTHAVEVVYEVTEPTSGEVSHSEMYGNSHLQDQNNSNLDGI